MATKKPGDEAQIHELLAQALETELGGIQVYETALTCVQNEELKQEWREYLDQTRAHHAAMLGVFEALGLDPNVKTPGREVVGHIGKSLVRAMEMARSAAPGPTAELVAAECVVLAETKDHANWELIGHVAARMTGPAASVLQRAHGAVEKEEDHHLFHTKGWSRELWIAALGFPAVLPPPEEVKQVQTAIGASRAEQARDQMLRGRQRGL